MIEFPRENQPSHLLLIGSWDGEKWDNIFSIPFWDFESAEKYKNKFSEQDKDYMSSRRNHVYQNSTLRYAITEL